MIRNCNGCKKDFEYTHTNSKLRYCSTECQNNRYRGICGVCNKKIYGRGYAFRCKKKHTPEQIEAYYQKLYG
jgi:hypothetical protein